MDLVRLENRLNARGLAWEAPDPQAAVDLFGRRRNVSMPWSCPNHCWTVEVVE